MGRYRKQYTLRDFIKVLNSLGYQKTYGKGDHCKWKKAGCMDVTIPVGKKEINRMMAKRLEKQIKNDNKYPIMDSFSL